MIPIQQALNGMIAIMMAKFVLNDVPHALGITGSVIPVQDREQVASSHWNEILKYCHTVDDLRKIASGQGIIKLYHGCPTEYAELMIKQGPRVPYKVEDTARYVARVYGIPWIAFYRWAYRRHEVREQLSTSTAPIAAKWAWSFPLGEVLTDLNAHARMYVAFKALSVREGISLDDAYDKLDKEAIEIAKATGQRYNVESAPDILGLPDKLALKSKTGALVEIVVNTRVISDLGSYDAKSYLEDIKTGELPLEEALLFWNHNYRDFRINPDDIISMRIVVRGMQPWEQDMIEDMIKEKQLSPYCGVPNPEPASRYIPPEEKYRLVKRTKRGSLVVIQREGDKAEIEVPNMEDMQDISNLLNASWIKWSSRSGISKNAWEGTPAYLRTPRGISKDYPGQTVMFDYSDLEKVMEGRILQPMMLEN